LVISDVPFLFENFWLETEGVREIVVEAWYKSVGGLRTSHLSQKLCDLKQHLRCWNKKRTFRLSQKLSGLKHHLRRWNKESVVNIFSEGKRLEGSLLNLKLLMKRVGCRLINRIV